MQSFENTFHQFNWNSIQERIYAVEPADVQRSLRKAKKTLEDFLVLLSPAASASLEEMAQLTQQLTQKRFGKTIQLYAPLYLSNECQNICTYCGFSMDNSIKRKTLNAIEIMQEAAALKAMGINHVLLVSGEANKTVGIDYFLKVIKLLRPHFAHISVEVQPLLLEEYEALHQAGAHAVLVYQETYHEEVYKRYHPKGKKSNFAFRLDTPDRIGKA